MNISLSFCVIKVKMQNFLKCMLFAALVLGGMEPTATVLDKSIDQVILACTQKKPFNPSVGVYITQLSEKEALVLLDFVVEFIPICRKANIVLEAVLTRSFSGFSTLNAVDYLTPFVKNVLKRESARAFFDNKLKIEGYALIRRNEKVDAVNAQHFDDHFIVPEKILLELNSLAPDTFLSEQSILFLKLSIRSVKYLFHRYFKSKPLGKLQVQIKSFFPNRIQLVNQELQKNNLSLINIYEVVNPSAIEEWDSVMVLDNDSVSDFTSFWSYGTVLKKNQFDILRKFNIALRFLINKIQLFKYEMGHSHARNDLGPILKIERAIRYFSFILRKEEARILLNGSLIECEKVEKWQNVLFVNLSLINIFSNPHNELFEFTKYEIYVLVTFEQIRLFFYNNLVQKAKEGVFIRLNKCSEYLTGNFSLCPYPYDGLEIIELDYINTEKSLSFMNTVHYNPKYYENSIVDQYYLQSCLQKVQKNLRHFFMMENCEEDFVEKFDANCTWNNLDIFVHAIEIDNIVETENFFYEYGPMITFKILRKASFLPSNSLPSQYKKASTSKASRFILDLLEIFHVKKCAVDVLAGIDWVFCLEKNLRNRIFIRPATTESKICTVFQVNYFRCLPKDFFIYDPVVAGEQVINFTRIVSA